MKAHQDFLTKPTNIGSRSQEILRRHLHQVPHILDDNYHIFITKFLFRETDPETKRKHFSVDMPLEDLDFFDEVEDFIFAEDD